MNVTFYGVRGSTPCAGGASARYGGNTSSVVVEVPGAPPLLLDLGTGVRYYGESLPVSQPLDAIALVTHLHWDHVQGLPFFGPIHRPGSRLALYSPRPQADLSLADAVNGGMRPPYFPVELSQLQGEIGFHEIESGRFTVGEVTVTVGPVPHVGATVGFRIDWHGRSVAYIPDHQQPVDGGFQVDPRVIDLAGGVDLLIHDAQYTPEEFWAKRNWGHSTVPYAVEVARRADATTLALFHHDPAHSDDLVDGLAAEARLAKSCGTLEIVAAREGLTVSLPPR